MTGDAAPPRRRGPRRAAGGRKAGEHRRSSWSLFVRLAWISTAAVLASLVFGGMAMYTAARIQSDQMLKSRLEQFGATIQAIVDSHRAELDEHQLPDGPHLEAQPTASLLYRYQVWTRNGRLLMRSHEAPAKQPMVGLTVLGHSLANIRGDEHQVFSLPNKDGRLIIQVAENLSEVQSHLGKVTAYYSAFLLLPLGMLMLVIWLVLRRTLHSINALAVGLQSRNPLDLRPIPVASPPRELVPILDAIDVLLARVRRAISIERSFTSLAAHEMRTPLAGLRAQAQFLSGAGLPAGDPSEAVNSLIRGVDRVSYMLDQLLDLARMESLALVRKFRAESVAIAPLHESAVADLAPRMRQRQCRVSVRPGPETVRCHGFALLVLLRNLLANAIAYSPIGGQVEVRYLLDDGEFVLTVDDSGQGIAAHQRKHAFDRFNRLGRTGTDGVGLGLSIVLAVVELHGARIELLDSPLGGLRVRVRFPQPAHGT